MGKYLDDRDSAIFHKLWEEGFATGNCISFKKGEVVILADTAIFSGMYKVRRYGEEGEYWTSYGVLKPQEQIKNNQTETDKTPSINVPNELDEANNQINSVWNGTTKTIRKALLPEQRAWLKQRENDCATQDDKIHCMAAMTLKRTDVLKTEIAQHETGIENIDKTAIENAGDEQWSSVKDAAAQRCTKSFEDFQLQAVCMQNEKEGYDKMQGEFGMPSTIAANAKKRCVKSFADFQLQAVCMQNEKDGYDKMNQ